MHWWAGVNLRHQGPTPAVHAPQAQQHKRAASSNGVRGAPPPIPARSGSIPSSQRHSGTAGQGAHNVRARLREGAAASHTDAFTSSNASVCATATPPRREQLARIIFAGVLAFDECGAGWLAGCTAESSMRSVWHSTAPPAQASRPAAASRTRPVCHKADGLKASTGDHALEVRPRPDTGSSTGLR